MKKSDVMLRTAKVLEDLYNTINVEEWTMDEELYDKEINRFFIVSNLVSSMNQYIYNNNSSKEDLKKFVCDLIDKNLD